MVDWIRKLWFASANILKEDLTRFSDILLWGMRETAESLIIPRCSGRGTGGIAMDSSRNEDQVRRNIPGVQVYKILEF